MQWSPVGSSTRISHPCLQVLDKVIMFRKILKGINTLAFQPHPPTSTPSDSSRPWVQTLGPDPGSRPWVQILGPDPGSRPWVQSKILICFSPFFQVQQFEKLATSDPGNLIDISPVTGDVINNQILDFEIIKEIQFQVTTGLYYKCLRP